MEDVRDILNFFHRMLYGGDFSGVLPMYVKYCDNDVFTSFLSSMGKMDPANVGKALRDGYEFFKKYAGISQMGEAEWEDSVREVKALAKRYGPEWGADFFLSLLGALEELHGTGRENNNAV